MGLGQKSGWFRREVMSGLGQRVVWVRAERVRVRAEADAREGGEGGESGRPHSPVRAPGKLQEGTGRVV